MTVLGSLMQTDKQRQQRYSHPKQVTSTLHRVPVPTLAQRPPRAAPTTTPQLPVNPGAGGSGAATAQSLEDYIRFSMLVSLSQQDVSTQTPLAAPLPPPAEVDTRHHAHGPSFGPHEGLLLSSGNTTANAGLVPMTVQQRSSVILPSPSGISTVSQTASPQASKVTAPSPHSLSAAGK